VNSLHEGKNGSIIVTTFMPFRAGKCDDTSPAVVDEFIDFLSTIWSTFFLTKWKTSTAARSEWLWAHLNLICLLTALGTVATIKTPFMVKT
jgi:hypothetical protein